MGVILCIETTTTNCSVAVSADSRLLSLCEDNSNSYSHAEKLHVYIQNALAEAGIQKNRLDAVAVSKGPGSYTGLRIGVSAAKGLCFALDIPLIATDTLQALSMQIESPDGYIVPMTDARRMEVYTAVFDQNHQAVSPIQALVLQEDSFVDFLQQSKVYFLGNGSDKFKSICNHPNAIFIENKLPSAKEMGILAEEKYKKSDFENVAYFEPYYLKDFISG